MSHRGAGEELSMSATASLDRSATASRAFSASSFVPWALLGLGLLAYLSFLFHYGRLFGQDDIFYKCAGFHWATDGHFAAPELTGRLPGAKPPLEKVFACYPPGYPFLFGLTVRAFGFGWRQVMFFDAVIHAALCALIAVAVWLLLDVRGRAWIAALVGLILIPLGTLSRPDELAMIFGISAMTLLMTSREPVPRARLFGAGVLIGLCAATSILPSMVYGLSCVIWLVYTKSAQSVLIVLFSALLIFALCVAPILMIDPHAPRQFFEHATYTVRQVDLLSAWKGAWNFDRFAIIADFGAVLATLVLGAAMAASGTFTHWLRLSGGAMVATIAIIAGSAGKFTYLWYGAAWLLVVVAVLAVPMLAVKRQKWVAAAALLIAGSCAGIGMIHFTRDELIVARLPANQRFPQASEPVRARIPAGAKVLVDDHWVSLAERCKTFDARFSGTEVLDQIDYVVLTGNTSGEPGKREYLKDEFEPYVVAHFQTIYSDLAQQPLTIGGVRITRSAYGMGACVMKRIVKPPSIR